MARARPGSSQRFGVLLTRALLGSVRHSSTHRVQIHISGTRQNSRLISQRRATSSSDQVAATSGRLRKTTCAWLTITANERQSIPKLAASSSSRLWIQVRRCSKDFPETGSNPQSHALRTVRCTSKISRRFCLDSCATKMGDYGPTALRYAVVPPTMGNSNWVDCRSTVSSVPAFGRSVNSGSLEKIMRPIRSPAATTWSSG
jgi:hypothetical protein